MNNVKKLRDLIENACENLRVNENLFLRPVQNPGCVEHQLNNDKNFYNFVLIC